jgi:hypothetical protein
LRCTRRVSWVVGPALMGRKRHAKTRRCGLRILNSAGGYGVRPRRVGQAADGAARGGGGIRRGGRARGRLSSWGDCKQTTRWDWQPVMHTMTVEARAHTVHLRPLPLFSVTRAQAPSAALIDSPSRSGDFVIRVPVERVRAGIPHSLCALRCLPHTCSFDPR